MIRRAGFRVLFLASLGLLATLAALSASAAGATTTTLHVAIHGYDGVTPRSQGADASLSGHALQSMRPAVRPSAAPLRPGVLAADDGSTAVIGRMADTGVAKDWAGHEVLDLPAPEWTLAKNDEWVESVIQRKMDVYVGSPTTWPNLWDAVAGRPTVFGRELQQFTDAGYQWEGWTLRAPGG